MQNELEVGQGKVCCESAPGIVSLDIDFGVISTTKVVFILFKLWFASNG